MDSALKSLEQKKGFRDELAHILSNSPRSSNEIPQKSVTFKKYNSNDGKRNTPPLPLYLPPSLKSKDSPSPKGGQPPPRGRKQPLRPPRPPPRLAKNTTTTTTTATATATATATSTTPTTATTINKTKKTNKWMQLLAKEKESEEKFLECAFAGIESVCQAFIGHIPFVNEHPMSILLYECTLMVREILNCWVNRNLHSVASSSLLERTEKVQERIKKGQENHLTTIEGNLQLQSRHMGWVSRELRVRGDILTISKGDGHKQHDLKDVIAIQDLHTGNSSEFIVQFNDDYTLHFKASNAAVKQTWMSFFRVYVQQSYVNNQLKRVTFGDKMAILANSVFIPYSSKPFGKDLEFLYAIPTTGLDLNWEWDNRNQEENIVDDAQRIYAVGLAERFETQRPATAMDKRKKDKRRNRVIEINLVHGNKINIYKLNEEMTEVSVIEITPHDLIDCKVDTKNLSLEIAAHPDYHKKFIFSTVVNLLDCNDLLQIFQLPPPHQFFSLLYQDILHSINQQEPTQMVSWIEDKDSSKLNNVRFSSAKLHHMFLKMKCNNSHCMSLVHMSTSLPFDSSGDLERIRFLVYKLFALGQKPEQQQCLCKEQAKGEPNDCLLFFYRRLMKVRGVNDIAYIVRETNDELLKGWAMRCVWGIISTKHKIHSCTSQQDYAYGVWELPFLDFSYHVRLALQKRQIGKQCVTVLFEILLGFDYRLELSQDLQDITIFSVFSQTIKRPELLPVLFLALMHSSEEIVTQGLENLFLLLSETNSTGNKNGMIFLDNGGYRDWIFAHMFRFTPDEKFAQIKIHKNLKMSIGLLSMLHYTYILNFPQEDKTEKNIVAITISNLINFVGWDWKACYLCGQILISTACKLGTSARVLSGHSERGGASFPHLFSVMSTIVEYIFFMPCDEKPAMRKGSRKTSTKAKQSLHVRVKKDRSEKFLDVYLVSCVANSLSSFLFHEEQYRPVQTSKEYQLQQQGKYWYTFFQEVKNCFNQLENLPKAHQAADRFKVITRLTELLWDEQRTHKTGRQKSDCDLVGTSFSPWFLSMCDVDQKKRSRNEEIRRRTTMGYLKEGRMGSSWRQK